ncbi:winged helix-turn-helix domain-containing protein [Neobacillus kokaensis]|uniref:HTH gntR-type domain-containing protein n=1 Tax=Neobacillus kokaensis TaxID=2759023 RepID=A0ABQ3N8D3_9BACI|nr:winged helix-turn-helix domain-containing protein [Neobacillus kokaensis]GHH99798.1 hypothetical protein AM1BK_33410 [Neobacillus kokaensis]
MNDIFDQITVRTIPEQIAEQIKQEIFSGILKPGSKLPPLEELSDRLGVSKPTISQALHLLQKSDLVSTTKGRNGGYFITESFGDKLAQSMYEMITFSLKYADQK